MASITGFGGIFLRADDPKALYQWYERHLGLVKSNGSFAFPASTQRPQVVFALFKQDNAYFPPTQKAMINLQVDAEPGAPGISASIRRGAISHGSIRRSATTCEDKCRAVPRSHSEWSVV
jgi:hypothetical protein